MSVINKMLKDLDRRQGLPPSEGASAVRAPTLGPAPGHEWLWRTLAVLMLVALVWACWVAYQVWPRPIATELALRGVIKDAVPAVSPVPAHPAAQVTSSAPVPARLSAGLDLLRLATEITTPIRSEAARRPKTLQGVAAANTTLSGAQGQAPRLSEGASPPLRLQTTDVLAKGTADKSDRSRIPAERAEVAFRQAVTALNQGRVSDAEELLVSALKLDPAHASARQTYIAMLLEQGRLEAARKELQVALSIDPEQARFALPLARIQAGLREYAAALEVLGKVPENAAGPELSVLRAVILQRLGRHVEAVAYYVRSLKTSSDDAPTLLGYGISLDALGRSVEAAQAYRRVLAVKSVMPEIRAYAEARLRTLE